MPIDSMSIDKLQGIDGSCRQGSIIAGDNYRFTILTPRLVRLEYAEDGVFEDRPTQIVLNRNFETPQFTVYETEKQLEIDTEWLSISYDKKEFSPGGLNVKVRSASYGIYSTWYFSEPISGGLWGTARSLDGADGAIPLEAGLQSRISGFGVLDDSGSLILLENGWLEPRRQTVQDLYFFGYGYAYRQCLCDFFHLCGKTPLLPRYALGNWWSRFYPYSDTEFNALMDRFAAEEVPLSVVVLDVDWHIRDIDPAYGKGWTGYTWNSKLFPDPKDFISGLHSRKLKVTLNLHPAEGVQPHEEMYGPMARALGRDPSKNQPIHFDFCDPSFIKAYFSFLHHPQEENGVDFWWIDWQQGSFSKIPGADPLWMLNHYHFLDSSKNGNRPMILSRYAGLGSHRYPVGFSGDSVISWASLQFQPYFTATAANIGYGWWSHDIGGHIGGSKDDELMVRWLQFGVFSPIMRLHSTSSLFNGKEPWKFGEQARRIMVFFLQYRHKLIPYLSTMNWRCYNENQLLVQPMYYHYPDQNEAYEVPNQYEFGSELIVCPITTPMDASLQMGSVTAWLPAGIYFDLFTGLRYNGGRTLNLYRLLEEIPVLVKAGAIIPMTGEKEAKQNGVALPVHMEIKVFGGADGKFEMYEDDGDSTAYINGQYAITKFDFSWNKTHETLFTIRPGSSRIRGMPQKRQYTIAFTGISDNDQMTVMVGSSLVSYSKEYDAKLNAIILTLPLCDIGSSVIVRFAGGLVLADNSPQKRIFELLATMQYSYEFKQKIYNSICNANNPGSAICELQAMNLSLNLIGAISEILFAS
jgi:alpha-glucosidase (family GH31 glycosyl hydrolase)